jgi:pimeloyl-ACP methyl ester carboxylesterase
VNSPTLPDVFHALGIKRDVFKGWQKRRLVDFLPETTQGVVRPMTREAAIGLGILKALLAGDVADSEAAAKAWEYAQDAGRSRNIRPIWMHPVGLPTMPVLKLTGEQDATIPKKHLEAMFDIREGALVDADDDPDEQGRLIAPGRLVLIPMGAIVQRIDRLFRPSSES